MPDRDCPKCHGFMICYDTRVVGDFRHRYLKCPDCGYLPPGKEVIPLAHAPRRRPLPARRPLKRRNFRRRR